MKNVRNQKVWGLKAKTYLTILGLLGFMVIVALIGKNFKNQENITAHYFNASQSYAQQVKEIKALTKDSNSQDIWIFQYATQFQRPELGKTVSLLRYQLACLAHKENGYHSNDHCGDGGLACGMYQYHPGTYTGFRKIMIAQGLTDHIGSRLNDQDAIQTTAWALTHGHEEDWGPILRGECQ